MGNSYECKLARGKTVELFEQAVNEIASMRDMEINQQLDAYMDVWDEEYFYFKPVSAVSFVDGEYLQVWMRRKPY